VLQQNCIQIIESQLSRNFHVTTIVKNHKRKINKLAGKHSSLF
jgi:hypothetical protein